MPEGSVTTTAAARLRRFRDSWEDDDRIDEESGLTAADLDLILAELEPKEPEIGPRAYAPPDAS